MARKTVACAHLWHGKERENNMAWNPSPKVASARDYGKKFNKKMVIIIGFDETILEVVTYGENKKLCATVQKIGDKIFEFIESENSSLR